MIMAGANPAVAMEFLREAGAEFPRLIDPACYETYTATAAAPFALPCGELDQPTLAEALDRQLRAGATVALTPTGYVPAGATDVLRAAARQFAQLERDDAIFVAPLDVSLLDGPYIARTTAILAGLGRPVILVLGRQFDPLGQSSKIIPNLRVLAAEVPLMPPAPISTPWTWSPTAPSAPRSAPAAGSGTPSTPPSGRCPTVPPRVSRPTSRPASWCPSWPAGCAAARSADLFGARPTLAPRCDCRRCGGRRLTGFLRREHQDHAIAHAVAVWSRWAADLLDQDTLRGRAEYWRNLCLDAVGAHAVISAQLGLDERDFLKPQAPLTVWAELPAWPAVISAARR